MQGLVAHKELSFNINALVYLLLNQLHVIEYHLLLPPKIE